MFQNFNFLCPLFGVTVIFNHYVYIGLGIYADSDNSGNSSSDESNDDNKSDDNDSDTELKVFILITILVEKKPFFKQKWTKTRMKIITKTCSIELVQ